MSAQEVSPEVREAARRCAAQAPALSEAVRAKLRALLVVRPAVLASRAAERDEQGAALEGAA